MADETDIRVMMLLREMRGSRQRIEHKLDELVRQVSTIELAAHSARMDRIVARLDRIKKRLGLVDAEPV